MNFYSKKELKDRARATDRLLHPLNDAALVNRARSVTVGTAFGGAVEASLRKPDGTVVYAILQPVEVIELIHQLAANVGCFVALKPRDDFAAWRHWEVSDAEKKHLNGHPPFSSPMAHHALRGRSLEQAKRELNLALPPPKDSNETVATEKPSKRRRVKRAAAAS